jgi:hypothetical protein
MIKRTLSMLLVVAIGSCFGACAATPDKARIAPAGHVMHKVEQRIQADGQAYLDARLDVQERELMTALEDASRDARLSAATPESD